MAPQARIHARPVPRFGWHGALDSHGAPSNAVPEAVPCPSTWSKCASLQGLSTPPPIPREIVCLYRASHCWL